MTDPIRAQDVEPEAVEFLWRDRIPKGALTVVAGRPDQGKGLFVTHVAADVTRAGGRVLYSAAEDSHSFMTRPRLEAAGAKLENVLLWRFALPVNMNELDSLINDCRTYNERQPVIASVEVIDGVPQEVEKPNPAFKPDPIPVDLLVMDPFASHLSNGISRHSDNVRNVLGPLTGLIEKTKTAVLIVEHALKGSPQGDILNVIGGSGSGLAAAARAAYVFGRDPDDEDARILVKAKFNVGQEPLPMRFEIDTEDIEGVGEVPLLVPDQELIAFDPFRLFEKKKTNNPAHRPPDKRAAAAEWLTNYLAQAGGPIKSSTIQDDSKKYGMASKTLRRAADDMGVVKHPPGGGRNCTWDLPDDVKTMIGLPVTAPATPAQVAADKVDVADAKAARAELDAGLETGREAEITEITDDMLAEFLGGEEA